LKQYPVIGFLTVFIFQGSWIFLLVQISLGFDIDLKIFTLSLCSSCLIGAIYPLSQIYQHQQDKADGVISISYWLGYKGTFIFSGILFMIGSGIYTYTHLSDHKIIPVFIFSACQLPVILFFLYWFNKVWFDSSEANYTQTMRMNIIAAICMNICFIILNILKT
jgi:1,4-dihydroxy-2-naphthoate octaprenyltransferase